jgi:hypothetical protein
VSLAWIMLGFVGWVLLVLVVLTLMRMSEEQDRQARHTEKALIPYSEVTITAIQGSYHVRRAEPRPKRAGTG